MRSTNGRRDDASVNALNLLKIKAKQLRVYYRRLRGDRRRANPTPGRMKGEYLVLEEQLKIDWQGALKRVELVLGHTFREPSLLEEALTHSSFSNEKQGEGLIVADNERLEFLGDAVIGLIVAELLMQAYPESTEGSLSRWRSALVSRRALAEIALDLGLGSCLRFGIGESRTGGSEKRSILAGALESIVGAVYKDAGLDICRIFLARLFEPWVERIGRESVVTVHDNKTQLQEVVYLYFRQVPVYRLLDSWGPEHSKTFRVSVSIEGLGQFSAEGRSKKEAEQSAAGLALEASRLAQLSENQLAENQTANIGAAAPLEQTTLIVAHETMDREIIFRVESPEDGPETEIR